MFIHWIFHPSFQYHEIAKTLNVIVHSTARPIIKVVHIFLKLLPISSSSLFNRIVSSAIHLFILSLSFILTPHLQVVKVIWVFYKSSCDRTPPLQPSFVTTIAYQSTWSITYGGLGDHACTAYQLVTVYTPKHGSDPQV